MKVHPVADLFPMMSEAELADLAEDMKANGQIHPIVVTGTGDDETLIDGRNRLRACEIAGIEPRKAKLNGQDPVAYIWSANERRRHMDAGQRAIVAAKACLLNKQTMREAGRSADVSAARIAQAASVLRYAPELADQVLAQTQSLNTAYEKARERKAEAETNDDKMARLRNEAPDLADLTGISLDEAVAKLERRKAEDAQLKTIEDDAPDLAAAARNGVITVPDAMAAFAKRNEEREAARRGATTRLFQIVHLIDVGCGNIKDAATRLMENVDQKMWPQDRSEDLSAGHLKACADMLAECAKHLKAKEAKR
jgi:ParB/Sulfiredoxin domain